MHVFSEAPQTPKPFTHDLDTYLKFQNLEYDCYRHVSSTGTHSNVHYGLCSQSGPCPHGGITLSHSLTPSLTVLSAMHPAPLGTPVGQFGTPSGSPAELLVREPDLDNNVILDKPTSASSRAMRDFITIQKQ